MSWTLDLLAILCLPVYPLYTPKWLGQMLSGKDKARIGLKHPQDQGSAPEAEGDGQ